VIDIAATQSWDLIRSLLALHRAGSFEGAARVLSVDSSTLRRRIQSLERQLGIALFNRRDSQLVLAPQQTALLEAALQMEAAYGQLLLHTSETRLGGTLRITTLDIFANLLAPDFARLHRQYPDIQLELTTEPHFVDLDRERIELAIRLARPLRGTDGLKRLATMHFAIYGAGDVATSGGTGAPCNLLALYPHHGRMDHEFLLADDRWYDAFGNGTVVARADGYTTLLRLCEQSMGLALLPCLLGDASPHLRRVFPARRTTQIGLWAVIRQDVTHLPKVRAVVAFLTQAFQAYRPMLAGTGRSSPPPA
jgi:DNA-binding transcriptional LysR family regulator